MIILELFCPFQDRVVHSRRRICHACPDSAEIVEHGWLTLEEFVDIVAIAEMTPGPIAVNAATFVGFRSASFLGGVVATGAVVLPSLIGILLISRCGSATRTAPVVAVFKGFGLQLPASLYL